MIVPYMKNENEKLKYLQKCQKFDSPEEILTGSYSDKETYYLRLEGFSSNKEDSQDLRKRNCTVKTYSDGEVSPELMIENIQRELNALTDLSPSVIVLATTFSKTLSHYTECLRCSGKISSSLPRILNRIQKLTEYVTTKRHGTNLKLGDYNYLRLALNGLIFKAPEKIKNSVSSELKCDLLSKKLGKQIRFSGKINATDITEGRQGIQIPLKFKSQIKKRLFNRTDQRVLENICERFPIVYLKEFDSTPIILILKPSPKPQDFWDKIKIILSPKELFYAYNQVIALPSIILVSTLVIFPEIRIQRIKQSKRTLNSKSIEPCGKGILQTRKNLVSFLVSRNKKKIGPKTVRRSYSETQSPNEKKSLNTKLLANAPKMVQDLLTDAEEEKMRTPKMKELELEIKQLKDLILEIRENQLELGKLIVEEGIYSQLILKFADPNMLEEEDQIVKNLAEAEEFGKKSSVENVQTTVDYVKEKCTFKNRMIMTLVKCLQSNLYKKWWEEVINSTLEKSKSIEQFNREKLTELIQKTSLFLTAKDEKESKESLEESRAEEEHSEEEPNINEVVGANLPMILSYQGKELVKTKVCRPISNFEEYLNCPSRMKILAFPVTNVPENMNSLIRKLESQISLLSTENEKLWQEVHELRNLLKESTRKFNEKRLSFAESERKSSEKIKASGKTISLTIQIASEKDFRNLNKSPHVKTIKNDDNGFNGASKSSSAVKNTVTEFVEADSEQFNQDQNVSDLLTESKFRSKSGSDLNDSTLTSDYHQENKNIKTLFREKNFKELKRSKQQLTISAPRPSENDILSNSKPIQRVSSKYMIPEVISSHHAGPSHRPADFRYLSLSPSRIELTENRSLGKFASMANERELQTIPEHDHTNPNCSSNFSKDVSQAIQYLRTRVRSIHKDVTVLKSRNDRIDKMLDKLIDDSNKNLNEIEDDLNNFKNRLS